MKTSSGGEDEDSRVGYMQWAVGKWKINSWWGGDPANQAITD